jgi:hypothetical protein
MAATLFTSGLQFGPDLLQRQPTAPRDSGNALFLAQRLRPKVPKNVTTVEAP